MCQALHAPPPRGESQWLSHPCKEHTPFSWGGQVPPAAPQVSPLGQQGERAVQGLHHYRGPAQRHFHHKGLFSNPGSPSTEGPSLSSFLLARGPQAIYINMFVTDSNIYTFFCLIKMFKLELAYCLWISRFC